MWRGVGNVWEGDVGKMMSRVVSYVRGEKIGIGK